MNHASASASDLVTAAERALEQAAGSDALTRLRAAAALSHALRQKQVTEQSEQPEPPPSPESLARQVAIDTILLRAGLVPSLDYVRKIYGEHWTRPETPPPASPPVPHQGETLAAQLKREADGEIARLQAREMELRLKRIEALSAPADETARSSRWDAFLAELNESHRALVAALAETPKPVEVVLQIEMPGREPRKFVAERDGDGRMTLSEVDTGPRTKH